MKKRVFEFCLISKVTFLSVCDTVDVEVWYNKRNDSLEKKIEVIGYLYVNNLINPTPGNLDR